MYQIDVIDNKGCSESLTLSIQVNGSPDIYLRNIIDPTSDNNGILFPQSSNTSLVVKDFSVYNRWGNLVFSNKNFPLNEATYGWNGSINGLIAESGVYIYSIY